MEKFSALEDLFLQVCGEQLEKRDGYKVRGELGIFSSAVIVWLGIQQRLNGQSQSAVLGEFAARLESGEKISLVSRPSRKLREGEISTNSGGLSRARGRLPESVCKELFLQSAKNIEGHFANLGQRESNIYLIDGLVLAVAHTKETVSNYGKVRHGAGILHYPRVRCVSAHRLDTGVCSALSIGNYTDHEITLAKSALEQLPSGSTVVMDRGFASAALIQCAERLGISVIVRLKNTVGKRLLASQNSKSTVNWQSSDRSAQVTGRVTYINNQVPGFRSSEFYLFTNTKIGDTELGQLYLKRLQVETAIRQVKQTLNLFFVSSKSPESIRKEIYIAYIAFNLIRAVMEDTAIALSVPVNRLSFTATIDLVNTYAKLIPATPKTQLPKILDRFRIHIKQRLLPTRNYPRSYPRVVKLPGDKYPSAAVEKLVNQEKGK